KWLKIFHTEELDTEIKKFKELTVEATFLIRTMFFILFGYLIETKDLMNLDTLPLALLITVFIFMFRAVQLKLSGLAFSPLLFIAPRGLITILLFLSIEPSQRISTVNNSLIIQVIILTAITMMLGIMFCRKSENVTEANQP
ncbi:MAG TPA: sodium:proton antiporter, partial [Bacteroidia bacterium]|nr:sodium:proton antiporter [Bacteroidia bacterium]